MKTIKESNLKEEIKDGAKITLILVWDDVDQTFSLYSKKGRTKSQILTYRGAPKKAKFFAPLVSWASEIGFNQITLETIDLHMQ